MNPASARTSSVLGLLLAAAVGLTATACLDVSERSQARAEISGPDGTQVQVITSTEFVQSQQPRDPGTPDTAIDVQLLTADTLERELPSTVTQSLTSTQRFFIFVSLADSAAAAAGDPVQAELRLLIDGDQRARATGDLLEEPLQVSFTSFVAG